MPRNLLVLIHEQRSGFSKGQKLIADYIDQWYDKAAFMTAAKLGRTVGVSESTVVRFAVELGYEGYPELQKALREMIRNKLTAVQRMEVAEEQIADSDVLDIVLNQDIDRIKETLSETKKTDFNGAVEALLQAKNIYLLGIRSSATLSGFLGFYFSLLFDSVKIVNSTSPNDIFEQILNIGPGDVIVGISFPRYSKRTIKALKFAADMGSTVIAITDTPASPITARAKYTLLARSDMASFVDSLVAPLSLINALIVAVGLKKKKDVERTFNRLEQIWEEYEMFEKMGETGEQ